MTPIRRLLVVLVLLLSVGEELRAEYEDHRFHNVDSLERVLADHPYRLYPEKADTASLAELVLIYKNLYLGYQNTNGERCVYYARQAMRTSRMA